MSTMNMTNIQPSHPTLTLNPNPNPNLSTNDSTTLQLLFDAESAPSAGITIDPSLPVYPETLNLNIDTETIEVLKKRELDIVKQLSSTTTITPSTETIKTAIKDLDGLIQEYPTYPSAYVNRAQALRVLFDSESTEISQQGGEPDTLSLLLFNPENSNTASRLFNDLAQAISLATPKRPSDSVSSTQARILADAHTHRGYLLLKAARVKRASNSSPTGVEVQGREQKNGDNRLRVLDLLPDQLEEMASRDLFFGGRYGNKIAGSLAVKTNPYAKMCGAIVKEAMREEFGRG